jgi:hypothetical protein
MLFFHRTSDIPLVGGETYLEDGHWLCKPFEIE